MVTGSVAQHSTWVVRTVLLTRGLLVALLLPLHATTAQTTDQTSAKAPDSELPPENPAQAAPAGQPAETLTDECHWDFRNGCFDRDHLLPVGNLSAYSWTLLRPDPWGLRIKIPAHQGRDKPTLGIAPALKMAGDFEITATCELVASETPDHSPVGAQIYILAEKSLNGASLLFGVAPDGKQVFSLFWGLRDPSGRKTGSESVPATAREARLRLARTGKTLHFLVAEEDALDFRELKTVEFGEDPIGLVRAESTNNGAACTVETLWSEIEIRARKLEPVEIPLFGARDAAVRSGLPAATAPSPAGR